MHKDVPCVISAEKRRNAREGEKEEAKGGLMTPTSCLKNQNAVALRKGQV
jgi:hypothetical protein